MSTSSESESRGRFGRRTKKPKKQRDPNNPGRLAQMRQVMRLARRHNRAAIWLAVAALVGFAGLGVVLGLLVSGRVLTVILWGLTGLMAGAVLSMFMLGRFAEAAAFDQMRGQPGAIGAVLNTARRGWLMEEHPIAFDPRTQEMVFRSTGRAGVVLMGEGRSRTKVQKLLDKEVKRHRQIVKGVPIHTFQGGEGEDQLSMEQVTKTLYKLPRRLKKPEILAVRNRLAGIGSMATRPPVPKGVDPSNVRPDRKALRGR